MTADCPAHVEANSSGGHDRHESHVSSLDWGEGRPLATSELVWFARVCVCVFFFLSEKLETMLFSVLSLLKHNP